MEGHDVTWHFRGTFRACPGSDIGISQLWPMLQVCFAWLVGISASESLPMKAQVMLGWLFDQHIPISSAPVDFGPEYSRKIGR